MKIITIKQPWATLIREGIKKYEFRSWKTNYRGEVYIHAGKGIEKEAMEKLKLLALDYPSSRIIAKATIVDCIGLTPELSNEIHRRNEIVYDTKERSGYAWKLKDIKKIDLDKEIKGKLGLWNLEFDVSNK